MNYLLRAASETDKGKVYKHNEDTVFTQVRQQKNGEPAAVLIVADGVGGHKAGEVASRIVVDTVINDFKQFLDPKKKTKFKLEKLEKQLCDAILDANLAIYNYAQSHKNEAGNLGSTVTCAIVHGESVVVANVGDSRTYHYHNEQLIQVTEDHSLVGEMVRKGIVAPEDVYTHSHRSVITRALGNGREVEVDTFRITLTAGDRMLLCSDGLWEMIRGDQELADILVSGDDMNSVARKFVNQANEKGGEDNIGVVVAEMGTT